MAQRFAVGLLALAGLIALAFRPLGPLGASSSGGALPLGGTRRRAVLAMLALDVGTVVSAGRWTCRRAA